MNKTENKFVLLILVFLFVNWGCERKRASDEFVRLKIDSVKVEKVTFFDEAEGYGKIEPMNSIALEAKFDGIVNFQKISGLVKKGEVIYSLTGPEITNRKALLQKNFELAEYDSDYYESIFKRKEKLAGQGFLSPESFEGFKRNYENAKIQFEKSGESLNYFLRMTSYTAPFNGYLSEIKVPQGSDVVAGEQLAKFGNLNKLKLVADFYGEPDFLSGRDFLMRISGKKHSGKLIYYEPKINPSTGGHIVWIKINDIKDVKPGDYVNYKILYNPHQSPAVPENALVIEKNNYFVVTVNNGKYVKREVRTGVTQNGKVEVKKGLTGNELVLTDGAFEIFYGKLSKTMKIAD